MPSTLVEAAGKLRERLVAKRVGIYDDENVFEPAYHSEVLIYIERHLMELYMPNEIPPENYTSVYHNNVLHTLETILPEDAHILEKVVAKVITRKIVNNRIAMEKRELASEKFDQEFQEMLDGPEHLEQPKEEVKMPQVLVPAMEITFDEFARRFQKLKDDAIASSRRMFGLPVTAEAPVPASEAATSSVHPEDLEEMTDEEFERMRRRYREEETEAFERIEELKSRLQTVNISE